MKCSFSFFLTLAAVVLSAPVPGAAGGARGSAGTALSSTSTSSPAHGSQSSAVWT